MSSHPCGGSERICEFGNGFHEVYNRRKIEWDADVGFGDPVFSLELMTMAVKKQIETHDPLAVYQSLVTIVPGLQIKGAKSNYTSHNGNMFSFLSTENRLALRLSDEDRAAFLKKHPGTECYQHGALMKHYVLVPDSMLGNKRQLNTLFQKCWSNAETLKSKPTKRTPSKNPTKKTAKAARKKK